ncbi:MAG TPA: IPT/TIG domain-containing protein [Candidatus Acidoferrum sp.]|jgi:uncharacterized repeat protein (TIGR01451 family)|nr:IPT/TIG domain-containing protein [Candidatus Acidoferrum sp.]
MSVWFRFFCALVVAVAGGGQVMGQVSISSFDPVFGPVGKTVNIYGTGFSPGTVTVKFNGIAAQSPQATSASQIVATVPTGATTGRISVQVGSSSATSTTNFVVIGPGPYVTDFSPVTGADGTTVFLDGVQFTSARWGYFAGQPAASFFRSSDSLISMVAPAGVVSGPLTITSSLGNYTTISNFDVPPTISGMAPPAGRVGTNVLLTGANFLDTFAVWFTGTNGPITVPASFIVLSNSGLKVAVPAGAVTGMVTVDAPAGSANSPGNFVVQPTIYGFSPGFGPVGSSVTITGANFNVGTPVVRFNGTAASLSGSPSFGQVTALVPSGATTGPISVTTSDGSDTSVNNFLLPASITSFTPTNGAAGTWIRVNGQNFLGVTAVSFNGQAAANFVITNNTVLGAQVPAGVITGPLSVSTPINATNSTGLFYGAPLIIGFNPTHGTVSSSVTITGTNFLGVTAVRFNGVTGGITSSNNGQIVATVLAGAQSGPITVVTPGGTVVSAGTFVVDSPSDLAISGTPAPNPVTIGSNLVYTIVIVNNGPNSAPNVSVTNTLPGSVTLKAATINQGTLATNGNPILGTLGTMNNGAAVTMTLTVIPNELGIITDTMSVGSDALDPTPVNNTASTSALVQSPALLSIQTLTNPPNQIKILWPADLTNYALQAKNSLLTNLFWSNVTSTTTISGNQRSVTEGNTNLLRFYRLKR